MRIKNREFDVQHHTYVMGILNVTPDSFSDGGKYNDLDRALYHAQEMICEGADILDIGGESTRPGHTQISEQEEVQRTVPVIEKLRQEFDVPLSIDTYKPAVAEAAIAAGADLVNDIWGLKYDSRMANLIAETGVSCCLMHNRDNMDYQDYLKDVITDLGETIRIAQAAGISQEKIMLDPGIGFAKSCEQNLYLIRQLRQVTALGFPVLLGTSRKSVIGLTLDLPAQDRLEGTLATTVYAVQTGCAFVRVHDVKENVRVIRMTEAIRDSLL